MMKLGPELPTNFGAHYEMERTMLRTHCDPNKLHYATF